MMSSSTKIVVLRSKELVYSVVLLIVSILIILVAVSIFAPSGNGSKSSPTQTPQSPQQQDIQTPSTKSTQQSLLPETHDTAQLYVPGIYTGVLQLGSSAVELQLTVDSNHINSINFTNIDDAVATMYPLMQPTLSELSSAIIEEQSIDNVTYAEESRYTSMLLLNAISDLLEKARISENADSPAQPEDILNVQ